MDAPFRGISLRGTIGLIRVKEGTMPNAVHVVGLDIAKSVFQVHCADERGRVVVRRQLKREQVEPFFQTLPACLVALEACPGAHFWGRLLRSIGHDVR